LEWSNNHSILVVLKAKYEQLLRKLKETPTTETVEQQSISSEREEFNAFLWDVIKSIKHLPTHEVKHCDSRFTLCVLMFVRPFVPKRDGTAAIAVYLPVVQNIMPFHQATLKSPLYANILCSIQYEGVV